MYLSSGKPSGRLQTLFPYCDPTPETCPLWLTHLCTPAFSCIVLLPFCPTLLQSTRGLPGLTFHPTFAKDRVLLPRTHILHKLFDFSVVTEYLSNINILRFISNLICEYIQVWKHSTWVPSAYRGKKRVSDAPKLELQVVVHWLPRSIVNWLRSFAGTMSTLNHEAISLAQILTF